MKRDKREKLSIESKMVYYPPEPGSMSISDPIYMASNFQYTPELHSNHQK